MKIKLSKSQWEFVGKKAGWMKSAQIIPDDGWADGGAPYTDDEMDVINNQFEYYINLNERGSFYADVRKAIDGQTVFEIKAGDELVEGESSIFEDGFMKHKDDLDGLKSHLVSLGIMKEDQRLVRGN